MISPATRTIGYINNAVPSAKIAAMIWTERPVIIRALRGAASRVSQCGAHKIVDYNFKAFTVPAFH